MIRLISLRSLLALLLAWPCSRDQLVFAGKSSQLLAAGGIVTTAACNKIRIEKYPARLDMYYFYTVEYESESFTAPMDLLAGIESAIAHAVASDLDECGERAWPVFAVELSSIGHSVSGSVGYCDNNEEDDIECHLVRGITSILLDNGAADAESVAYATIQRVLTDTLFLNQFTTTHVLSAEFVRPIQENLILLNEPPLSTNASDGTAKIAIATASVSCLLTCVFLYGLYRARALSRERAQTPVKARVAHLQAKRRRYFQELQQDQQLEPGWMVTDSLQLPVPSITWSVSDLTSDSGSIRSSMSYATKLDRIEEEVPVDGHDEENVAIEHPSSLPSLDLKHEHLDFIAHWNHHTIDFARGNGETDMEYVDQDAETPVRKNRIEDFDATAEEDTLTGCRYLDDSQEDDEDVLEVDQSNDTTPTVETFSIVRYSSVFGDPPMNITAGFFKFVKTEVFDLVAAPESIDQEEGLERWFRNVLLDLHRALHQKRLAL